MFKYALFLVLMPATLIANSFGDSYPDSDRAKSEAIQWIRAKNAFGPDHQMVNDLGGALGDDLPKFNDMSIIFGPKLMASGQPAILWVWAGQVFSWDLTVDQARALNVEGGGASVRQGSKRRDLRSTPAVAKLSSLKVNDAGNFDPSKATEGEVEIEVFADTDAKTALRLSYSQGSTVGQFYYPPQPLTKGKHTLKFRYEPMAKGGESMKSQPMPVFVDLVSVREQGGDVQVVILGNSTAEMLQVR